MLLVKNQNLSKRKTSQIWIHVQIIKVLFAPFYPFQNLFGIWGYGKKQSWSLSYEDQLWYTKFLKFTYKIWSNFEIIKMLKCTPNSNFKMEAEFENIPWSKVVELEKLSNFHFWRFSTSLEKLGVICKMNSMAIL